MVDSRENGANNPTSLHTRELFWPINTDIEVENKYLDSLYEGKTYDYPFQNKHLKRQKTEELMNTVLPSLIMVLKYQAENKRRNKIHPEILRRDEYCFICYRRFVNRSNMKRHVKFTHMMSMAKR